MRSSKISFSTIGSAGASGAPRSFALFAIPAFGSPSESTVGNSQVFSIERIGKHARRPLTKQEDTNIRFAVQFALGTINNAIINRPGPIFLGQELFVKNLVRAFRLVSDYDNLTRAADEGTPS